MYKRTAIVMLAFAVYYTQSLPTETSEAKAQSESNMHFYSNNVKGSKNYHLAPVLHELEVEDQEIEAQLGAVLPFFNFLIRPSNEADGEEDCLDQLELQVIPDNN